MQYGTVVTAKFSLQLELVQGWDGGKSKVSDAKEL
jgi:hypothetical protein